MRNELTEKLYSDFPDLYHDYRDGFDCDDGWYGVIYKLSERITALIAGMPEVNPKDFRVEQVEEKLGGLKFYKTRRTDERDAAIDEAINESFHTCERCGMAGVVRLGTWYVTQCDMCYCGKEEMKEHGEVNDSEEKGGMLDHGLLG